jgi:protein-S-isoprenylcysteine O-methyltransferase Ste14
VRVAAGALVALLGVGLAVRSALLLAGRGRPQRGPRPAFVIAGPYVRMRNPLAAGVVGALAGGALMLGSATLGTAAAIAWAGAHLWIVRVEEPRLRARFGPAYEAYLRAVPRWIPLARGPSGV